MKKGWFLHLCLFPFISFVSFVCVAGCESSSMCFLQKLLMERILLLAVLPALLLADTTPSGTPRDHLSVTQMTTQPKSTNSTSSAHIQFPFQLTSIKVSWENESSCQGRMVLLVNFTKTQLCLSEKLYHLSGELCKERRCGKVIIIKPNTELSKGKGHLLLNDFTVITQECSGVTISCASSDVLQKQNKKPPARKDNNELLAYKVITGLLVALVLAVLLFRFARPVYNAFRKRFSKKQQNRWIGPTQSQSVSYHRGQGGHLKPDTGKRQSYPGLEMPSSNRNSEYESYSYN